VNTYLLAFTTAAVLSLFLTRVVRDFAIRRNWLDMPDAVRKMHAKPIPAVGGVAIAVSVTLGLLVTLVANTVVVDSIKGDARLVATIGVLALGMMLVGAWDDICGLSAHRKFALQIVLALAAWEAGFRIEGWGGTTLGFGVLSLPITVLWIVGLTNAFNMIDGVDGLAAGAALFATMALMVSSIVANQLTTAMLLAAVAGATAGFLRYNFNPASIFLGDSGSLLLGFTLALLAIDSSQKSTAAFAVAVPIVSLALPVLDTTVVVIRRLIRRQPLFAADRRHIHHVLLDRGESPRRVVIGLYAVCGLLGLVSLLFVSPASQRTTGAMLAMLGIAIGIGVQQLQLPELKALNAHVVQGIKAQRRLLAGGAIIHTMLDRMAAAATPAEVLAALGDGLTEAGFSSAALELPSNFPFGPLPTSWSAVAEGPLCVLHWDCGTTGTNPEVELNAPLLVASVPGRLILWTATGGNADAALVSWISNGVASALAAHLVRTSSSGDTFVIGAPATAAPPVIY